MNMSIMYTREPNNQGRRSGFKSGGGRGTNLYVHICMHNIYIYIYYIYIIYIYI